jgi:hypothetical protein
VKRIPRITLLVSLAGTLALSAGGIAWADGAGTENSSVIGAVNSNVLPASDFGNAQLFSEVQTLDSTSTTAVPAEAPEQVFLDYDNSLRFTANNNLAKCTSSDATLATQTTAQAVAGCGASSVVGSGAAKARVAPGVDLGFTVTAFNGPTSTPGGACTAPGPGVGGPVGCAWVGGDPTIILFARLDTPSQSVPVRGEIENGTIPGPAQQGGDVGYRLAVTDAPDVGGDSGALILFNALVGKNYNNGKSGKKKKTYSYVQGKCDDGDLNLNYGGTWVYDDASVDTGTWTQDCAPKP